MSTTHDAQQALSSIFTMPGGMPICADSVLYIAGDIAKHLSTQRHQASGTVPTVRDGVVRKDYIGLKVTGVFWRSYYDDRLSFRIEPADGHWDDPDTAHHSLRLVPLWHGLHNRTPTAWERRDIVLQMTIIRTAFMATLSRLTRQYQDRHQAVAA